MSTNCGNFKSGCIVIAGTCLEKTHPDAFKELSVYPIYTVCLEETHLNMVITKIIGILSRSNIEKIIFATVDKSPHCIQMHYIENEIQKICGETIPMIHYVAVGNRLIKISSETVKRSRNLALLEALK